MEIAVYTYEKNTFINEDSPLYKASSVELIEEKEELISIDEPQYETYIRSNIVLDKTTKTSLKELYALGYRLIQKENNFFYLEKE